jgi:hypothetical protein
MEKADKENKNISSSNSSGKKPKINPNIKITPTFKNSEKENGESEKTTQYIQEKLKDFELEEQERKAAKTAEEEKAKIVEDVRQMAALADDIYIGKVETAQDPASKVKAMYDLFKSIAKNNTLESVVYDNHVDILDNYLNNENNTIHKLQILIRDLQEKTPKIHEEVENFIQSQKEWRVEKEVEFQKSIETIRSQMAPKNPETGESEMVAKYNELCEYVDQMKNEGIDKVIQDRDDKIKELEDTKNVKLRESKQNIEEKIQTLMMENQRLSKELPKSRKDYSQHKSESKKLVQIIEANNKKKKQFKDTITKLNQELHDHKKTQKELKSLIDSLSNEN